MAIGLCVVAALGTMVASRGSHLGREHANQPDRAASGSTARRE